VDRGRARRTGGSVVATWMVTDAIGRPVGMVDAPSAGHAVLLAAERRPFAAHPLRAALLAGTPASLVHPSKTPEALAKRAATVTKQAAQRRRWEALMSPKRRAKAEQRRRDQQKERWRRYYLRRQGLATP
jgi:hypothetical protein